MVCPEAALPGLWMAIFSLCPSSHKDTNFPGSESTLLMSLQLHCFSEDPVSKHCSQVQGSGLQRMNVRGDTLWPAHKSPPKGGARQLFCPEQLVPPHPQHSCLLPTHPSPPPCHTLKIGASFPKGEYHDENPHSLVPPSWSEASLNPGGYCGGMVILWLLAVSPSHHSPWS